MVQSRRAAATDAVADDVEADDSPLAASADAVLAPSPPFSTPQEDPDSSTSFDEPGPLQEVLAGLTVAFSLLSKARSRAQHFICIFIYSYILSIYRYTSSEDLLISWSEKPTPPSRPQAVACSAIVGVDPLVGIWSSVAMGAAAPALGMRPGVIAGSAAVVVVPLGAFVAANGPELIPLVVLLAAAIEARRAARAPSAARRSRDATTTTHRDETESHRRWSRHIGRNDRAGCVRSGLLCPLLTTKCHRPFWRRLRHLRPFLRRLRRLRNLPRLCLGAFARRSSARSV